MAKYGSFRYNSGTKYGTGDAVTSPAFTGNHIISLQIDWAGTGFDGTNEAVNMTEFVNFFRGRRFYVTHGGDGFERFEPGRATLKLDNKDGRYDAYNESSPLYPNVAPGKKAKLIIYPVVDGNAGTAKTLLTGKIEDIRLANDGSEDVYIDIVDDMEYLNGYEVSTDAPVYYTTMSSAIERILTAAEWSEGRNIQTNTQPLVRLDIDQVTAGDLLQELADASLGSFFIDRYGKAVYYGRAYNSMTTHTIGQDEVHKVIPISQPWENIRNNVSCVANKPMKGPLVTVWDIPSTIYLSPSESRTITAEFSSEGYMEVVLTSTQATSGLETSSTDISANVSLTYTIKANSAIFYLTNTSSVRGAFIRHLTLQGREIKPIAVSFREQDTTSQTKYGSRRFKLDSEYLQNINHAEAFAEIIKDQLKDPNKSPIIEIKGRSSTQFDYELLDKVAFTSTKLNIDDTFYVGGIEIRQGKSPQDLVTRLHLQQRIYDNSTIADDPYDAGEGTIPENPTNPGVWNPNPQPPPVLIECINDPGAAQNGPYSIFSNAYHEIITTQFDYQQFDIWFRTVVRMESATHKTVLSLRADRLVYLTGNWYNTDDSSFYEIWAISSTGAPLFQAESIVTQGDYIAATFAPAAGTVVAGFRVKLIAPPESQFDVGYTFDFESGPQGWFPPEQSGAGWTDRVAQFPINGNIPYDTNAFKWDEGYLGLASYPYPTSLVNCWIYKPTNVYTVEGASLTGEFLESLSFSAFGVKLEDGAWIYGNADTGVQTMSVPGYAAGKKVYCFAFHAGNTALQWNRMNYLTIAGFTTSSKTFKMIIRSASIENICAIPEE